LHRPTWSSVSSLRVLSPDVRLHYGGGRIIASVAPDGVLFDGLYDLLVPSVALVLRDLEVLQLDSERFRAVLKNETERDENS